MNRDIRIWSLVSIVWLIVRSDDVLAQATVDELVKKFEAANHTLEVVLDFDAVFRERGIDDIEPLRFHESDTIAIRAAWESVRRSVPEEGFDERRAIEADVMQRFLGFLEGRIRSPLPSWWETAWMQMSARERDGWLFDDPQIYGEGPHGAKIPEGFEISESADFYLVRSGERTCRVALKLNRFRHQGLKTHAIPATFTGDRLLIGFCDYLAQGFKLYCIDWRTSKVVWSVDAWAGNSIIFGSGPAIGSHSVEIVVERGRVFLFGMDLVRAYVECFSLQDGARDFKFSTRL